MVLENNMSSTSLTNDDDGNMDVEVEYTQDLILKMCEELSSKVKYGNLNEQQLQCIGDSLNFHLNPDQSEFSKAMKYLMVGWWVCTHSPL